jgi:PAS domain S-box-containing protein
MLSKLLHVTLLAASGLTTAALAGYAWRRRAEHAVGAFCGLMVAFTLYSGAHLLGLLTLEPGPRLLWEYVQWTGTAAIPAFWLLFTMEYAGYDGLLGRRPVAALSAIPLATVALAWTNRWHGLMWTENTVVVMNGLAVLEQPFGPWAVLFSVFTYAALAAGAVVVLRLIRLSDRLYAGQALLLVVGVAAPLLANLLTVAGVTPIRNPPLDLSPYAFSVTGLAFGYALFRHRLLEIVPATHRLGRNAAIRDLEEGVIIVDTDRQVIYCNPAAADLLDCEPAAVLGEPVRSLVDDDALDFDTEVALAELDRGDRTFEVRTSPIRNRRDRPIGHTLIVQDVTARNRRERRLERQRDELERLDELNSLIRGVNRALVSATDRAGLERAVCERLVEGSRYRTACIADVATWNGDADRWTVAGDADADGTPPLPAALDDAALELDGDPGTPALDGRADDPDGWTVVPVTYGRTVYGALGLRRCDPAETPPAGDREREVLAELGELVGHAIEAVENRRLLSAESVLALEFRSEDDGALFGAATAVDGRLELSGLVPDAGDGHLAYVRVTEAPVGAAADALEAASSGRTRVIRGDETGGLVEWVVPGGTLVGTLVEGGSLLGATAADGAARFEVEVAADADVRALVERVREAFPETRLETKREHDRPAERADSLPAGAADDLTDRQREVLEAAYRAGYFEWPRESTAEEVADSLDIAAPTLHGHLRKAEAGLLADLFGGDAAGREPGRVEGED